MEKLLTKSILVTGATGFIGSRLVNSLIDKGYNVTSLIRKGKKGNLKSKIIYGDLTDEKIDFKDNQFDCIFHLASHTPLEKNKKILEKVNLEGTKKLFKVNVTKINIINLYDIYHHLLIFYFHLLSCCKIRF